MTFLTFPVTYALNFFLFIILLPCDLFLIQRTDPSHSSSHTFQIYFSCSLPIPIAVQFTSSLPFYFCYLVATTDLYLALTRIVTMGCFSVLSFLSSLQVDFPLPLPVVRVGDGPLSSSLFLFHLLQNACCQLLFLLTCAWWDAGWLLVA